MIYFYCACDKDKFRLLKEKADNYMGGAKQLQWAAYFSSSKLAVYSHKTKRILRIDITARKMLAIYFASIVWTE